MGGRQGIGQHCPLTAGAVETCRARGWGTGRHTYKMVLNRAELAEIAEDVASELVKVRSSPDLTKLTASRCGLHEHCAPRGCP